MPSYIRKKDESAFAWLSRLRAVNPHDVSPDEADELTYHLAMARLATKLEPSYSPTDAELLDHCKKCVRALSNTRRRELARWLRSGMVD